jgi:hypothetical protein
MDTTGSLADIMGLPVKLHKFKYREQVSIIKTIITGTRRVVAGSKE